MGTDTKGFEQYDTLFMQLSDDRRTVNAFELQELLETCLPNDYIKSCASIEVCRQVVVAMDKERSSLGGWVPIVWRDLEHHRVAVHEEGRHPPLWRLCGHHPQPHSCLLLVRPKRPAEERGCQNQHL